MTGPTERRSTTGRRWLRAPVVHFVLIGGLLFAVHGAWQPPQETPRDEGPPNGTPPSPDARAPIVISASHARRLQSDFAEQFGRPASRPELGAFIQQAVDNDLLEREARRLALDAGDPSIRLRLVRKMRALSDTPAETDEALYRQAIRLGLDDDLVVRRLLREKMRMVLRQDPVPEPIGETEVREYVERHRDRFVRAEAVTFSHVFLSARVRGERLRHDADAALAALRSRAVRPDASDDLSDPFPLGLELRGWSRAALARQLGDAFAGQVLTLAAGRWSGPIASPFGLHLVWIHEKLPGAMPSLEGVWPRVARELLEERAAQRLARGLERLRNLYAVRVELPAEMSAMERPIRGRP